MLVQTFKHHFEIPLWRRKRGKVLEAQHLAHDNTQAGEEK